jgi:uncharacterized protein
LKTEVEAPEVVAEAPPAAAIPAPAPSEPASGGISPLVWGGALVAAVLLFLVMQWR